MIKWLKKKFHIDDKNDKINTVENKKLNLQKLTPTKCDSMEYYQQSLDFVFKEPDLLNIAVTGAYSAGKSSVIQTYEDLNKDKKFIHLSLAHFEQMGTKEDGNEELDETKLEGKILNQLIHQINPQKIPQTRFKVKSVIRGTRVFKNTTLIALLAILSLYLIKFKTWITIINSINSTSVKDFLNFTTKSESFILSLSIGICIFSGYLYQIIKKQLQKPIFKKITLQNTEIEIFEKEDESYFDKYLDEILYLFQNADLDVIVFEDIDRYNNNIIFSKLREINFLINKKPNQKPIRFFYLLRDDIFTSKDRTKFFDFMMPIVPIIDSSNSYNQILRYFSEGGIIGKFDKSFLERLSLYIDDMRILKNIYNEYVIYNGRIQSTELDDNKLLAIIVYKNIFPKDFSELQLNLGFVYNIFINKDVYAENCKKLLDLKIEKNLVQIKTMQKEQLESLDELDTLYFTSGLNNYAINRNFDNSFKSRFEFVKEIKKNNGNIQIYNTYNGTYSQYNAQADFDKIHNNPEYISRKKIIEQKSSEGMTLLNVANVELQHKKGRLDSLKLRDLISKENIDEIFTKNISNQDGNLIQLEDVVNSPYYLLIKYLIRNGYIDESYFDYLTYFYENSLSKTDKIFLRSVTDEIAKDYNYKLKDINTIITRLKAHDFGKEEVFNFDLLCYLLEHNHSYLGPLLKYIKENQRFDFVWEYIVQAPNADKLVKELNIMWNDLLSHLLLSEEVSKEQKYTYLVYTLYYSLDEDNIDATTKNIMYFITENRTLENMNFDNCISEYLRDKSDFLNIEEPKIEYIIAGFKALDVSFKYIDYEKSNKKLFEAVYENWLFDLNFPMIEMILEKIYQLPVNDDFKQKNYTLISSKPDESLKKYVYKNMNGYILLMLDNIGDEICDSQECAIDILNNSEINVDHKISYIQKLTTIFHNLKDITAGDRLWEILLNKHLVSYSTHNALVCYFDYTGAIDDVLINYLNKNTEIISFNYDDIEKEFEGKDVLKFFAEVINCNDLLDERYKMILKGFGRCYKKFTFAGIKNEKFKILINYNIIYMTKDNIVFVRENYQELVIFFICTSIQAYIDCLDNEILLQDELLQILKENGVSDEHKINLIKKSPEIIRLHNSNYSEKIQIYIIHNNFDIADLEYLIKQYEISSSVMKELIQHLCILNIKEIYDNQYLLSYCLLHQIISNIKEDNTYKKKLLLYSLEYLDIFQTIKCMTLLDLTDFLSLFDGKRPKILATDENHNFLTHFKKKGWINSFDEDVHNSEYYRVIGRKYKDS